MYISAGLILDLKNPHHPMFCCVNLLKILEGNVCNTNVGVAYSVKPIPTCCHLSSFSKSVVGHLVHDAI